MVDQPTYLDDSGNQIAASQPQSPKQPAPTDQPMYLDDSGNQITAPQQFKPGDIQQKPGGSVTNIANIPTPETEFYKKHPANVLYRDIRSRETPEQIAARQATAKQASERIAQPVRTDDLMTPEQQKQHPIASGALDIATGFITPENIGIMAATEGLGTLAAPSARLAAETLPKLISAGFTVQQIWGAAKESNELWDAIKRGDSSTALRLTTHIVGDLGMAALGAQHAAGVEARPSTAVGRSIDRAIDTGTTRFSQAFKSDTRAMATASAKHEAAITAYEQRYDEQGQMANQAVRASQNAQAAKEAFENGTATQKQLDDANTAASKAASNLRKATQALSDAHDARSQAAVEVDRMTRKMMRNQGKTSEADSKIVNGRKEDFKSAIPATKRGPAAYNERDLDIGMGYLDQHHTTVQPVESVQDAYDAFDHAQKDIENKVHPYVERYGKEENPVNVRMYVADKLEENPIVNFAQDGLDELENYNLRSPSIEESDRIRQNLNAANRPVFGRDPVDVMTRLETDPKFAARYYAAEALRQGEYDLFEERGVQGIREARRDEASIIKLKMAAERQIGKGDVKVRGSGKSGKWRQAAQWAAHKVGVGVGASIGAELGPAGAAAGAAVGDVLTDRQSRLGRLISPADETRDALVQRHMKYAGKGGVPVTQITGVGEPATTQPLPTAISPRMQMYVPQRELTPLHSELATHYNEDLDTPYLDLEQRFREDVADKKRHNVPLEPAEKTLLGKINAQDAVDRANAQKQQVENLAKGKKPAVPNYPEHIEPLMQAPGARLATGMDTQKGIIHGIANAVVGSEKGLSFPDGVRSHIHPDSQAHGAVMEAPIDLTPFLDEEGKLDPQKMKTKMADIAAAYVAGGVANDLYHDIPFTENHNLGGDVRVLKSYMRRVGFTDAEATRMIAQAADDAAMILNKPEVEDMIERHASVREGGLDSKYHVSPERMEQIIQDVKDAANEGTTSQSGRVNESSERQPKEPGTGLGSETETNAELKKGNTAIVRQAEQGPTKGKGEEIRGTESADTEPGKLQSELGAEPEDEEDRLIQSELQTPRRQLHAVEIMYPPSAGGESQRVEIPAFSIEEAVKIAQKQYPAAAHWSTEATPREIPTEQKYEIPTQKRLSMRKGGNPLRTDDHVERHELGHALLGLREGMEPSGILRHTHPIIGRNTRAAMLWDAMNIIDPTTGRVIPEKIPGLMRNLMGGIAADEAFNDYPRESNHNLRIDKKGSDGNQVYTILRKLGLDHSSAIDQMNQAIDQAKQYLTDPAVSGIIQENVGKREPGLSRQYHYSPDRLNQMHAEIQRRINAGQINNRAVGGENIAGRGENVAPGAGPGTQGTPQAVRGATQQAAELAPQQRLITAELGIPESRVSTRVTSGKDATENHLQGTPLEINRAAVERSPQKLQDKFADKMRDLPGMKIPKNISDNGKVYDRAVRHIADNLKFLYNKVDPQVRTDNAKWYESAHGLAQHWSAEHGYAPEQTAGAIASLSPQTEWDTNVSLAKRIVDIHKNHLDETVTPEMIQKGQDIIDASRKGKAKEANQYLESILDNLKGKKIGELSGLERAAAVRLYDEVHNSREFRRIDPATGNEMEVRTNADGSPAAAGWGNFNNMAKALSILDDGSRENISNQVGESHKVRNFYNNIIDPSNPDDVTIDTHAVGAATLTPMSGNTKEVTDNFGGAGKSMATGVRGTYPLYAEGYRLAAKELGIKARELQSVTWEKVRDMFSAEWKTKENSDLVRKEWKKYTDGKQDIDKTRDNIYKMGEQAKAQIEQNRQDALAKAQAKLDKQSKQRYNRAGVEALAGGQ